MHRKVNKYNAFELNEYNGTYEIVSGNESDDGKFYIDWVIASKYDEGAGGGVPVQKADGKYMSTPVKVVLGNREEAVKHLKWLLNELLGPDGESPPTPLLSDNGPPVSTDVPF